METLEVVGIAVGALVLGAGGAYAAVRFGRPTPIGSTIDSSRAQEEIRQAEARGEEANRELDTQRNEVRELERRVEKREDAAEQRHKELARKERHQDAVQKKLSERKELLEKKSTQLEELITE